MLDIILPRFLLNRSARELQTFCAVIDFETPMDPGGKSGKELASIMSLQSGYIRAI
jgi:hypothetical protein